MKCFAMECYAMLYNMVKTTYAKNRICPKQYMPKTIYAQKHILKATYALNNICLKQYMLKTIWLKTTYAQNNICLKQHRLKTTYAQNNICSKQHLLQIYCDLTNAPLQTCDILSLIHEFDV